MQKDDRVRIAGTSIFGTVTTSEDKKGVWIRFGDGGETNHIGQDNPIYKNLVVQEPELPNLSHWSGGDGGTYFQKYLNARSPEVLLSELKEDVRSLEKYLSAVKS